MNTAPLMVPVMFLKVHIFTLKQIEQLALKEQNSTHNYSWNYLSFKQEDKVKDCIHNNSLCPESVLQYKSVPEDIILAYHSLTTYT